jgi:hypothetical protein
MNKIAKVDDLGTLLAQIADLTVKAEGIKEELREAATAPGGENVFEGDLFKATVVAQDRKTVDYKTMLKALGVSEDTIKKYTSTTAIFAVKTTAR